MDLLQILWSGKSKPAKRLKYVQQPIAAVLEVRSLPTGVIATSTDEWEGATDVSTAVLELDSQSPVLSPLGGAAMAQQSSGYPPGYTPGASGNVNIVFGSPPTNIFSGSSSGIAPLVINAPSGMLIQGTSFGPARLTVTPPNAAPFTYSLTGGPFSLPYYVSAPPGGGSQTLSVRLENSVTGQLVTQASLTETFNTSTFTLSDILSSARNDINPVLAAAVNSAADGILSGLRGQVNQFAQERYNANPANSVDFYKQQMNSMLDQFAPTLRATLTDVGNNGVSALYSAAGQSKVTFNIGAHNPAAASKASELTSLAPTLFAAAGFNFSVTPKLSGAGQTELQNALKAADPQQMLQALMQGAAVDIGVSKSVTASPQYQFLFGASAGVSNIGLQPQPNATFFGNLIKTPLNGSQAQGSLKVQGIFDQSNTYVGGTIELNY